MSSPTELFCRRGWVVLPAALAPAAARLLHAYCLNFAKSEGEVVKGDRLVPGTPSGYGHPCMERAMQQMLPTIAGVVQRPLFPTYSYFRVYRRGNILPRHIDRPACEISFSLCLGYQGAEDWPLRLSGPLGDAAASLRPGDGVLYKGTEIVHWREPFEGESAAQVFLHYVDQNGPHAEWRFDKRPGMRTSAPADGVQP